MNWNGHGISTNCLSHTTTFLRPRPPRLPGYHYPLQFVPMYALFPFIAHLLTIPTPQKLLTTGWSVLTCWFDTQLHCHVLLIPLHTHRTSVGKA